MRKKVLIGIIMCLFLYIIGISNNVDASAGITYYMRDAIIIENIENIKIQEYNTVINTEKSIIEEKILLANMAKEDTVTEIRIPLDYKELGIEVKDLEIKVNNLKINNIVKNEKGEYVFKVKINAGEGKKIEIQHSPENNLRDAKIIKYNFSNINLNGRSIGKLKFDIVFPEEDIPLVTEIYPGHFTFDNNTVTVEYYNFTVNALTETILIEKDTYSSLINEIPNLLEEAYAKMDNWQWNSIEEKEKSKAERRKNSNEVVEFLKKVPELVKNLENLKFPENYNEEVEILGIPSYSYFYISLIDGIEEYILDKLRVLHQRSEEISIYESDYDSYRPLIKKWKINNWKPGKTRIETEYPRDENNERLIDEVGNWVEIQKKIEVPVMFKNQTICVDYNIEREDKELYVTFIALIEDKEDFEEVDFEDPEMTEPWKPRERVLSEFKIYNLEAGVHWEKGDEMLGNIVEIKKKATAKEKADYVNMINADFYIKYDLYELAENETEWYDIGYYKPENREIAEKFGVGDRSYERTYKIKEVDKDETLKLLDIPALVRYVAPLKYENGKYTVYGGYRSGKMAKIEGIDTSIETARAQELINENHAKNERTKQMMDKKISDLVVTTDIEEYVEKAENVIVEGNEESEQIDLNNNADYIDIIVLSVFGVSFIACLILLIINIRKRI